MLLRSIKLFEEEKHHILEQEYIPKFSFIIMKISKFIFWFDLFCLGILFVSNLCLCAYLF